LSLNNKKKIMRTKTSVKLLLTVLCLSISLAASALSFGPIAGVNLSNVTGDGDSSNAMKVGFHFGGIVELSITDNFIIAPGVIYSVKGTQDKDVSDNKLNLSYLEIPINAKYRLESGLNFFAGPYVGFLMSATAEPSGTDVKDFLESSDIGLNVGLGFDLEGGLGFSAQYGMGLTSISKDIAGTSIDNKNSTIGISIRYMLGGK
jgi:hypothetical protein